MVQAVIGEAAALRMEKIMALFQGVEEIAEAADVHVGRLAAAGRTQALKAGGLMHGQRLVRAKRGQHPGGVAGRGELAVMLEVVHRIIRGADVR